MMEMPDILFIQLGRDRGRTFIRKFDTKSSFDGASVYVNYDEYQRVYDELKKENEENCRLLGMSAEREIQLLQKVQQLEDQVSCLMQNSESQTQTQMALIKKLAKTEWRPIESAPHGIWVLIFAYGNVCQACWNSNGYWSTFRENRIQPIAATHWMPLPEPPTTEETKCPT